MNKRPYVLTIAGFDPSSGAGVTSDIKTFEQHEVYGLSVVTAVTYQNESQFIGVKWLTFNEIESQLMALKHYKPQVIKIGLIESATVLSEVLDWIKRNWPETYIIWDPILKASAGFPFHKELHKEIKALVSKRLDLLTPNLPEYTQLFGKEKAQVVADELHCSILVKGGHTTLNEVCDNLYTPHKTVFSVKSQKVEGDLQKHGTGCILSSVIAAELAKAANLESACSKAHYYVKKMIGSNPTLLAYHQNI